MDRPFPIRPGRGRCAIALAAALSGIALTAGAAAAQPADGSALRPLCPDRPGKGTSPCTLDRGHWQVEVDAADYTHDDAAGSATTTWVIAAPVLKYGLTDSLDLEAGLAPFTHVSTRSSPGAPAQTLSGFGDLYLRAKLNLFGNGGGDASVALEPYVKAPTAHGAIGDGAWEEGVLAAAAFTLPHGWSLSATPEADVVLNASGSGRHLMVQLPVGLGHSVGPVAASVELWTAQDLDPSGSRRQYSFDLSGAWQPPHSPDLQLDAGVNLGLNAATPDVQLYVGASRRF